MKLVVQSAPYIRKPVSVRRMMLDVIIALLPVVLFACIQNGWNGVYVILISVSTMLITELFCVAILRFPKDMKIKELFSKEGFLKLKQQYTINNITAPLISSLIYALLLPAGCSGYVVFIGAFFGMFVGKMIFGGLGSNIFNPAAVGRVFLAVCFGSQLIYTKGGVDVAAGGTPLALIKDDMSLLSQALQEYSLLDLFLGQVPGSMGEVSALMILIGGIYLFARRSADLRSCLSMIASFCVLTLVASIVAGNVASVNIGELFLYELLSGGLLFGAVFMITDPVTSPTTKFGRIVFGTIVGSLTALIRYCGAYPEGVAFSILIANMFVPAIDHLMRGKKNTYTWKQILGIGLSMTALCLIVGFAVAGRLGGL